MKRGRCPVCKAIFGLRKDGALRAHQHPLGRVFGGWAPCSGAGREPSTESNAEALAAVAEPFAAALRKAKEVLP